jgi:hypothetical protein
MLRERITITLEPSLIDAVDLLVDGQTLRNRSHAIEHLLKEGIGLHELEHAFLFFAEGWTQVQLDAVLRLCKEAEIRTLFLCLPTGNPRTEEVTTACSTFATQLVPSDFGSGGALVLKKESIAHPFLMAWIGPGLAIPKNLLLPFTFHRQHHALLTRVLTSSDGQAYQAAGIDIAQPELIDIIPAGIISLQDNVFPQLIREAKMRGYATHTTIP